MKFAIFGAGADGKKTFSYLGKEIVECFIDNNCKGQFENKRIISFESFLQEYRNRNDVEIVVASTKYGDEILEQIVSSGYTKVQKFAPSCIPVSWVSTTETVISIEDRLPIEIVQAARTAFVVGDNDETYFIINHIKEYSPNCRVESGELDFNKEYDLIVLNVCRSDLDIRRTAERRCKHLIDFKDYIRFTKKLWKEELLAFHNIHQGERIFVIGNGPSLKVEDLEVLYAHNEITIGVNKIYKIYDSTPFRATYLGFADERIISDCMDEIVELPGTKFINGKYDDGRHIQNAFFFSDVYENYYPDMPGFSSDIMKGIYWGNTVTYELGIQMAAYMGAREIYLIGVDHSFVGDITDDRNHFIKDYYKENGKYYHEFKELFPKEQIDKAYEMADSFSRRNGFRIYNATRGGKLDIFERVDFDMLFQEK